MTQYYIRFNVPNKKKKYTQRDKSKESKEVLLCVFVKKEKERKGDILATDTNPS